MVKRNNQPGYILTLTLGMIALCIFISTYVFNKGFIFSRFSQTMVEREKARQLAYGGLQLAISQLAMAPKKEETSKDQKQDAKAKESNSSDAVALLKSILPHLNKPQKFTLKQPIEGINATISIVIGSEEGKININKLYDFEKHTFIGESKPNGDMKKMFQELFALIKEKVNADLFADFETFLKERKYPLNDVTELLKIKGFEVFKNDVYYDPFLVPAKKDTIYLTDIFTISSSKKEIDPWLFSNSLQLLLKLKQEKAPSLDDLLKSFKEQSDWKNDWNKLLAPLYGIEFPALPKEIASLLNPSFAPKMFSVLSQAVVGTATIGVWALLEREKGSGKDALPVVHIRAVYLV